MQLRHSGKYFTDRYLISIQQICGQTVNPESHYKIMRHFLQKLVHKNGFQELEFVNSSVV